VLLSLACAIAGCHKVYRFKHQRGVKNLHAAVRQTFTIATTSTPDQGKAAFERFRWTMKPVQSVQRFFAKLTAVHVEPL